jgi:hypothetical protein
MEERDGEVGRGGDLGGMPVIEVRDLLLIRAQFANNGECKRARF